MNTWSTTVILGALLGTCPFTSAAKAAEGALELNLRSRAKAAGRDRFAVAERKVAWEPKKTALIICDMWDDHWCKSAARRVAEMAGPLNDVAKAARSRGVLIIHGPRSVTASYKDTPQRKLAREAPFARTPVPLSAAERWGTR